MRSFGLFQTFFSGFALFLGTVRDLSEPHQATGHGLFSLFFSFLFFCFVFSFIGGWRCGETRVSKFLSAPRFAPIFFDFHIFLKPS